GDGGAERARGAGPEPAAPPGSRPHGRHHPVHRRGLRQVGERARPDRLDHPLILLERGKHDDRGAPPGGAVADGLEHVQAACSGHDHVEQHHIGPQRPEPGDRARPVRALARHLDVLLLVQDEPQALADHVVVVDDEHPDHGRPSCPAGSRTMIAAPLPGEASTWNSPPSSVTRSRISVSPIPCRSATALGSNPRPSSRTSTVTEPLHWLSRTRIVSGSPCLAAFPSASCTIRSTACSAAGPSHTAPSSAVPLIASRFWYAWHSSVTAGTRPASSRATGRSSSSSACISRIVRADVRSIAVTSGRSTGSACSARRRPAASRLNEKRS